MVPKYLYHQLLMLVLEAIEKGYGRYACPLKNLELERIQQQEIKSNQPLNINLENSNDSLILRQILRYVF